jgi:hypothetical protein
VLLGVFTDISGSQETSEGGSTGFINFLIFVTVILGIAVPLWIYFKMRPDRSVQDQFNSSSSALLTDEQQQFLSGTIAHAPRMVNAASYVADELVREVEEERALKELQRQRAIRSAQSAQNWAAAAQMVNAIPSPSVRRKSGCSGCGMCLLAFGFVGIALLIAASQVIL